MLYFIIWIFLNLFIPLLRDIYTASSVRERRSLTDHCADEKMKLKKGGDMAKGSGDRTLKEAAVAWGGQFLSAQ